MTLSRVARPSDCEISPYSGYVLQIKTTGTANPGLGGFTFNTQSYANADFYTIIQAKIPLGYNIEWATNSVGDGRSFQWLTPTAGTGDWETYVVYVKCGSTGSFSTTNFFYLKDGPVATASSPVTWFVSNGFVYDLTGMGYTTDSFIGNMGGYYSYTFGNENQTLVALWQRDLWTNYISTPKTDSSGTYLISSANELAWMAYQTRLGNLTGKNFKMTKDVDLAGHYWFSIGGLGNNFSFIRSTFDGNGFKITNLNIESAYTPGMGSAGLFGLADVDTVIKNVIIESGTINTTVQTGGILGWCWTGTVEGCVNRATINSTSINVGGIVGSFHNPTMINCKNYGSVTSSDNQVGGLVGAANTNNSNFKIVDSTNYGAVNGSDRVGGILGNIHEILLIENCKNSGKITCNRYSGGIVGVGDIATIRSCENNGVVECSGAYVGGIMGCGTDVLIDGCINNNTVSGGEIAGGIVGILQNNTTDVTISNCVNKGAITVIENRAGGIVGHAYSVVGYFKLNNCRNFAAIKGVLEIGGIAGYFYGTMDNCFNINEIAGSSRVGGIIGYDVSSILRNVRNSGTIEGNDSIGGIAGQKSNYGSYYNAYNTGFVTAKTGNAGGMYGAYTGGGASMSSGMTYCYNAGNITAATHSAGLVGAYYGNVDNNNISYITIANCGVNATITTTGSSGYTGGLVGYKPNSNSHVSISNCYFQGLVNGHVNSGATAGFIGHTPSSNLTINNSYASLKVNGGTYNVLTGSDFSAFAYASGVNNSLPVPKGLFHLGNGGSGEQNVLAYLQGKGFTVVNANT